jgi:hypothetical protein
MSTQKEPASFTIADAMTGFLSEQQARLSPKQFAKYRQVLELFEICLENYWPGAPEGEYARVTKLGGTFCTWFGPEKITDGYSEFLGYYMGHKVYGSLETKRAAGTVMARFAEWLDREGLITGATLAVAQSKRATRDLPAAEQAGRILERSLSAAPPGLGTSRIEDHFTITRVEPGRIWLSPFSGSGAPKGPIAVPEKASQLLKVNWDILGAIEKTSHGWRLVEVVNVTA